MVTGATGFVGSSVTRALLGAGHQVLALVRDPARAGALTAAGAGLHRADMLEPESYTPQVAEVDAVVHTAQLAQPTPLTRRRTRRLFDADAVMTGALTRACLSRGARLVYTGGCFDYGDHGSDWIDETTPLTPSPLGIGHAARAAELDTAHRDEGLDVVRVSPGFVYGPGGLFRSAFVDQARRKRLRCIGRGENYWSCIHVDDLATAYVAAVTTAAPGTAYAAVDDEPLTLREITDLVTTAAGAGTVGTAPPALLGLLLGRPLVASLITSFRIRNTRLRGDLGWTPTRPRARDGIPSATREILGS